MTLVFDFRSLTSVLVVGRLANNSLKPFHKGTDLCTCQPAG